MITDNTIRLTKYPPELFPDSWFGAVPLNADSAPPILDLRRFAPYLLTLTNIQVTPNAAVEMKARYDAARVQENTAAMAIDAAAAARVGAWHLQAKESLFYNTFGVVGAPVANYPTHYGIWAYPPTIAHKLLLGITLTSHEKAISEEFGIANTVEKGLLPLPLPQQLEREYPLMGEETHSRSITVTVAVGTIESLYPKEGEFIALTKVAAAPGTAVQNVHLYVDRDQDASIADLATFPLSLANGGEVACFIPAMEEIRLTTDATVAPGAHLFRYTFKRFKLNNILRVRFGLVSEDEVSRDLWNKVKGGIL